MDFQEARSELQTLLSELSSIIAQCEWKWNEMANNNPADKQDYLENAETCREIEQGLEELSVPSNPDEIGNFMNIVRKEAGYCPRHWELSSQVAGVLESMEQLVKDVVRSQLNW